MDCRSAIGLALSIHLFVLAPAIGSEEPEAVFSAEVEVVNVIATVRDKQGALVDDLGQDDFVLKEDGERQTIQYFARQTDLPLTIGLLVDTSMSQRFVLEQQRAAVYRFLDRVMTERDQAFVIGFDAEVELIQDLTSSKRLLEEALGALRVPDRRRRPDWRRNVAFERNQFPRAGRRGGGRRGGGGRGPAPGRQAAGTALYDAVFLAADEMLSDQAGRKALVLVSDGVDLGSKLTDKDAIEAAQRHDGIVYSIYFPGSAGGGGFGRGGPMQAAPEGDRVLRRMSRQTGGQLYKLSGEMSLNRIFDTIEEELRSQYSIGYTPSPDASPGFRKIELKTKRRGLKVSTRSGYYPGQA